MGFDFTKSYPQDQLNQMIDGSESMLQGIAQGYLQEYGTAAIVKVQIFEKNKDANGNYTSLKARASIKIDLASLPSNMKVEDVWMKELSIGLGVDIKTGARADVKLVMNPKYTRFNEGQDGLKEYLDKLMAMDPETLSEVESFISVLDDNSDKIVNGSF